MSTFNIKIGNVYEYEGNIVELYLIDFPNLGYRYQDENNNGIFRSVSILDFIKMQNFYINQKIYISHLINMIHIRKGTLRFLFN